MVNGLVVEWAEEKELTLVELLAPKLERVMVVR